LIGLIGLVSKSLSRAIKVGRTSRGSRISRIRRIDRISRVSRIIYFAYLDDPVERSRRWDRRRGLRGWARPHDCRAVAMTAVLLRAKSY
jgi:hypothetical protein